jgi:hypothetical protein
MSAVLMVVQLITSVNFSQISTGTNENKIFPVPAKDAYGCVGIAPHTLNVITRWRLVISFKPWQSYPWYP